MTVPRIGTLRHVVNRAAGSRRAISYWFTAAPREDGKEADMRKQQSWRRIVGSLAALGVLASVAGLRPDAAYAVSVAPCEVLPPISSLPHFGVSETPEFLGVDGFAAPGPETFACTLPSTVPGVLRFFDLVNPASTEVGPVSDYLDIGLPLSGIIVLQSDPSSPEVGLPFRATVAGVPVSRIPEIGPEGDNGTTILGSAFNMPFDLTVRSDVPGAETVPAPPTGLILGGSALAFLLVRTVRQARRKSA